MQVHAHKAQAAGGRQENQLWLPAKVQDCRVSRSRAVRVWVREGSVCLSACLLQAKRSAGPALVGGRHLQAAPLQHDRQLHAAVLSQGGPASARQRDVSCRQGRALVSGCPQEGGSLQAAMSGRDKHPGRQPLTSRHDGADVGRCQQQQQLVSCAGHTRGRRLLRHQGGGRRLGGRGQRAGGAARLLAAALQRCVAPAPANAATCSGEGRDGSRRRSTTSCKAGGRRPCMQSFTAGWPVQRCAALRSSRSPESPVSSRRTAYEPSRGCPTKKEVGPVCCTVLLLPSTCAREGGGQVARQG